MKQLQIRSRRFHCKAVRVSTVSMVSLKTTFKVGPLDRGTHLCWGGVGLCQTVATAGYIIAYDITHPVQPQPIAAA